MKAPKPIVAALLVCGLVALAPVQAAEPADSERGRLLYENHCVVCHTAKVHRRTPQLPLTAAELRQIVSTWASSAQLGWSAQEVADVAAYLERSYYPSLPR